MWTSFRHNDQPFDASTNLATLNSGCLISVGDQGSTFVFPARPRQGDATRLSPLIDETRRPLMGALRDAEGIALLESLPAGSSSRLRAKR